MSLKESFKPTKTKIIIISLILLLYVFTIYTLETKSDKVMSDICEGYQEYMIPKLISIKNGDNETANKIQEDFERNKHKYEDIDELIEGPKGRLFLAFYFIIYKSVPSSPDICLPIPIFDYFFSDDGNKCDESYFSEKTYDCVYSSLREYDRLNSEIYGSSDGTDRFFGFPQLEKEEYKEVSIYSHIIRGLFLIIEIYIVLFLLSLIFKFLKERYYNHKLNKKFKSKRG